jgi:nucleotide-binding universal stress UspA family protein
MAIKKILVPMNDAKADGNALSAAIALARAFDSHIEVLHVRPDPRSAAMAYMGEPVSASMIEEMMEATEKRAAAEAAKVRKAFEDACAKARIPVGKKAAEAGKASASFETETGNEDEAIRLAGRVADLVVMARPQGPLAGSQRLVLEAALLDTGRPLLVVPPKASKIGTNVAIAWNGSAQASRAIALAMDFIVTARTVTILTAKEDGVDYQPDEVSEYLGWHGIKAKAVQVASKGDAAKALLSAANRAGADLLVMGAYGHSRVRELVLGGVTKHVLQETTIPTLMAH